MLGFRTSGFLGLCCFRFGVKVYSGPPEVLLRGLVLPGGDLGNYRVQGEGSGYEAQGLGCLVVSQNRPWGSYQVYGSFIRLRLVLG